MGSTILVIRNPSCKNMRSLKGQNQVCEINTITLEAQPSESATNFDHCGDENRCR